MQRLDEAPFPLEKACCVVVRLSAGYTYVFALFSEHFFLFERFLGRERDAAGAGGKVSPGLVVLMYREVKSVWLSGMVDHGTMYL